MSIAEEISKLHELLTKGALTQEEFAQAKLQLISAEHSGGLPSGDQRSRVNDLLFHIDREWELEREKYMIVGANGRTFIPRRNTSIAGAAFVGIFGLLWTVFAFGMTFSEGADDQLPAGIKFIFPLMGLLMAASAIFMGGTAIRKAIAYEAAQEAYKNRRRAIIDGTI